MQRFHRIVRFGPGLLLIAVALALYLYPRRARVHTVLYGVRLDADQVILLKTNRLVLYPVVEGLREDEQSRAWVHIELPPDITNNIVGGEWKQVRPAVNPALLAFECQHSENVSFERSDKAGTGQGRIFLPFALSGEKLRFVGAFVTVGVEQKVLSHSRVHFGMNPEGEQAVSSMSGRRATGWLEEAVGKGTQADLVYSGRSI